MGVFARGGLECEGGSPPCRSAADGLPAHDHLRRRGRAEHALAGRGPLDGDAPLVPLDDGVEGAVDDLADVDTVGQPALLGAEVVLDVAGDLALELIAQAMLVVGGLAEPTEDAVQAPLGLVPGHGGHEHGHGTGQREGDLAGLEVGLGLLELAELEVEVALERSSLDDRQVADLVPERGDGAAVLDGGSGLLMPDGCGAHVDHVDSFCLGFAKLLATPLIYYFFVFVKPKINIFGPFYLQICCDTITMNYFIFMARKRRKKQASGDLLTRIIGSILLLSLSLIIILSFFNAAGTVGSVLNEYILSFLFGVSKYAVPFILIIVSWYIISDSTYNYKMSQTSGAIIFFLAFSSIMHMSFLPSEMWSNALEGNGGGVFGMMAWPMKTYFGGIAAWIVLVALVIISLVLIFHSIAHQIADWRDKAIKKLAAAKAELKESVDDAFGGEEEYDEDESELEDEEDDDAEDFEDVEDVDEMEVTEQINPEEGEAEYDEESEEEDVEEKVKSSNVHQIPAEPSLPFWQENVIVKDPPSVKLLNNYKQKPTSGDINLNSKIIQDTLREFKINVSMEDIRVGPTVTQYTLRPDRGTRVNKITALSQDLALALAAHPIRIEAPIPGKSLVGIEVPNTKTAVVTLRELINSKTFDERKHDMMIGLGKDVAGKVWFADLPRMPHLLIAGSTGSGKSVCMNTIICSLLYQNTAETLRMIMVDPKRVELTPYNGIPHLLTPVITNVKQTVNALNWAIREMERRFEMLQKAGNVNIVNYNDSHPDNKLPYIAFIIDELADLMITAAGEIETGIIRLAQMARAVGIHVIVATQRPSVDVITGLMKSNIPGRIAFSVASVTDSRTIIDSSGAEKLIGKGDMLLSTSDLSKPVRIQGAFISEEEVKKIVKYLKGTDRPIYDESIVASQEGGGTSSMFGGPDDDQDPLFHQAKSTIIEAGQASTSFLQRKLKVGYARAARIMDELEEAGVIGATNGSKPREILISEEEYIRGGNTGMGMGQEANVFNTKKESHVEEYEEELEDDMVGYDSEDEDNDHEEYEEEDEIDDEDEIEEDEENNEKYDDENDEEYEDEDYEDNENDDTKDGFQIRKISP